MRLCENASENSEETEKPDIQTKKPDIFGRSDVMKVIDVKPSRASELLKDLEEHGIIEPVSGHGKGKHRFRQPTS